jgi:putative endonuclease
MQPQDKEPQPDKRTAKRKLGDLGENIACDYLKKHGFEVVEKNYLRKWGELDIVAKKKGIIRFIEVKSVTCATLPPVVTHATIEPKTDKSVRLTNPKDWFRPEDNMHPWKLKRLSRAIQTYLLEKRLDDVDWQLDVVTVKIDEKRRVARVEMIENIII